ncbi:MAG: hypothetical protein AAF491_11155, partial [Verrucomicrobiota bacterium]
MALQNLFLRVSRFGAVLAGLVLIPESIFFFALAMWKGSRFLRSVQAEGAPTWYLLISSIGLLTGAFFCLATSRRLLKKPVPTESDAEAGKRELEKLSPESRFVRRIGKVWLSLAFSVCVFVLPPVAFFHGAGPRSEKRSRVAYGSADRDCHCDLLFST